jgi:flagellar capping protein FliD
MVTQITLGNIFTQNGRQVISGGQSGLDIEGLIKGIMEAKRQPAVVLEKNIEKNTKTSTALGEMRTSLNKLKDAANFLRKPPGVQNASDNIFEYRSASLSSNDSTTASNYMGVTIKPGAKITNYEVEVKQLATSNVYVTNTINVTNLDTAVVGVGAGFAIQAGTLNVGANGTAINLVAGDTLSQVVSKVNAAKSLSGVEADTIKVADGQYRLSLKTIKTGASQDYNLFKPAVPSFMNDAIFRIDANDVNGNSSYLDNPTADVNGVVPTDVKAKTTITSAGGATILDVNGATSGAATFDFNNGQLRLTNNNDIGGAVTPKKSFAFSFKTGANISGTQVIYEQGNASQGYNLQIAPDAANGNAPTLFAVANNTGWGGANTTKALNLGVVTANTDYNVVLNFDASASPTTLSSNNTFTGFVNGEQKAQTSNMFQMAVHSSTANAIGGSNAGLRLANGTTSAATGFYFQGNVNEVASFNRTLSSQEIAQTESYFDRKYIIPQVGGGVFSNIGFAITQEAKDSIINVDGTDIKRSSNAFNDVVDGVSFNLLQATPVGTKIKVGVKADIEIAKQGIMNFVNAYNEFRLFASKQSKIGDDGKPLTDSVLAGNTTLNFITGRVNAEIASVVRGITDVADPDRLADIGIKFSDFPGNEDEPFTRNILTVDEDALKSALESNFDAVRKVFEFDYSSDNANFQIFQRTNDLSVNNFNVNIVGSTYTATYTDSLGVTQSVELEGTPSVGADGVVLKGKTDTPFAGLVMIYGANGDATIAVNVSQGLGDRLYNSLDDMLKDDTGAVDVELKALASKDERSKTRITTIDEQLSRYRDQLLSQYSALEAAISSANTILQTIDANNNARNSNN